MRVTKLEFGVGRTLNTGNYESFRFEIKAEVELEPEDIAREVYEKLRDDVLTKAGRLEKEVRNNV